MRRVTEHYPMLPSGQIGRHAIAARIRKTATCLSSEARRREKGDVQLTCAKHRASLESPAEKENALFFLK